VTPADPERIIAAARAWLGTPYHDQASLRGTGCDGVWREVVGPEPFPLPPYSRDWGETGPREASKPIPQGTNRSSGAIGGGEGPIGLVEGARRMMIEVPVTKACPGALVLFRMMPRANAKHVGILTAPGSFIHAYDRLGVIEQPLTQSWRRRIAFAFLFPEGD
jgi:NlpC/P60 family putative phage cell wall peptidase